MSKLQELESRIKMEFVKERKPLTIMLIHRLSKDIFNTDDLAKALKYLVKTGIIERKGEVFIPSNANELKNMVDFKGQETPVTRESILEIIKTSGSGTPSEIAQRYIELKGQANPETITRIIRFLFAEGALNRRNDVYFTNEIKLKENLITQYI